MGIWFLKGWVVYPQSKTRLPGSISVQAQSVEFELPWTGEKTRLAVCIVGHSNQQFKGDYTLYLDEKQKQKKKVSKSFIHLIDIGKINTGKNIKLRFKLGCKSHFWQVTIFLTDDFAQGNHPKNFSDEKNPCVYASLLHSLVWNNREAEADYFGRLIVERDPKCSDAWTYLGMSASHQGRHSEGISLIQKALEINDQSAVGWSQLGIAYIHNKQLVEAEKSFKEVFEVQSHPTIDSWDSMSALFAILIVTNRISQAKEFVKNISGFLLTEHPDVPAESGNRWIEFLETVIDKWEGKKASVEQTYHSDMGRRALLGWSQVISEYGKTAYKELIERASRLNEIAEGIFG